MRIVTAKNTFQLTVKQNKRRNIAYTFLVRKTKGVINVIETFSSRNTKIKKATVE